METTFIKNIDKLIAKWNEILSSDENNNLNQFATIASAAIKTYRKRFT